MPAVSKGDGMRGLAVFISDIRNCKYPVLNPMLAFFYDSPYGAIKNV